MAVTPLSLKVLPNFESLTAAESLIFEGGLEEMSIQREESVPTSNVLLVVRQGKVRLEVETEEGPLPFAVMDAGGLLGEMAFFEPEPVAVSACGEDDTVCFAIDRPTLKNAFRYCRTGAVKLLASFARSLSHKLRSANELLHETPSKSIEPASKIRPTQLDPLDLQRLTGLAIRRSFSGGDVLFAEGDVSRELFVIGEGEVEIAKKDLSGQDISLARLGPGDFFGEMAFVDDKPRSASAIAHSELLVHMLPSGSLERALEYNVGTALYLTSIICKIMARRLNVTLKRLGAR